MPAGGIRERGARVKERADGTENERRRVRVAERTQARERRRVVEAVLGAIPVAGLCVVRGRVADSVGRVHEDELRAGVRPRPGGDGRADLVQVGGEAVGAEDERDGVGPDDLDRRRGGVHDASSFAFSTQKRFMSAASRSRLTIARESGSG